MSEQPPAPRRSHGRAAHLFLGHGLALAASLLFALNLSLIKFARSELGAVELASVRFWLASSVVLAIWTIRGRPRWGTWDARTWRWVVAGAILLGPVFMVVLNSGAVATSAGLMGLINATQALHLAWMGRVFVGERLGGRQVAALGVGFAGVSLPLVLGGGVAYTAWWGPALIGLAAAIAALNVIVPKALHHQVPAIDLVTTLCAIAAVTCLPLMAVAGRFSSFAEPSGPVWAAVLWMGLVAQIGVAFMWYTAARRLTAVTAALYIFVLMIAASGWGYVVLGEVPHWSEGAAAVIVVAALRMNVAPPRRGASRAAPATAPGPAAGVAVEAEP